MVHRLLLFLGATSMTDQHAPLRHTVAQIHPWLWYCFALFLHKVIPLSLQTGCNSEGKNRELSIIIYVSTLVQSHKIRTETFAFDTQLDLFSDNDRRTIHYPAYYSVTCQNDRRHSSKISLFNDFVAILWLPLRKHCYSRKYNFKVPGVA